METFAVTVFPVAKPDEWRAWIDSVDTGERADPHRQFLRRLGVKREHVRYQASPAGDVMVLIWKATSGPGARADGRSRAEPAVRA